MSGMAARACMQRVTQVGHENAVKRQDMRCFALANDLVWRSALNENEIEYKGSRGASSITV
jgi:hypothetical protein